MNTTNSTKKLEDLSLSELLDLSRGYGDDDPHKLKIDLLIMSKLKSPQHLIATFFTTLGNSQLEAVSLMGIKDILTELTPEQRCILQSKVERFKEVLDCEY